MPREFQGTINLDIGDSTADWPAYPPIRRRRAPRLIRTGRDSTAGGAASSALDRVRREA